MLVASARTSRCGRRDVPVHDGEPDCGQGVSADRCAASVLQCFPHGSGHQDRPAAWHGAQDPGMLAAGIGEVLDNLGTVPVGRPGRAADLSGQAGDRLLEAGRPRRLALSNLKRRRRGRPVLASCRYRALDQAAQDILIRAACGGPARCQEPLDLCLGKSVRSVCLADGHRDRQAADLIDPRGTGQHVTQPGRGAARARQ
jgi:hypothetical protein